MLMSCSLKQPVRFLFKVKYGWLRKSTRSQTHLCFPPKVSEATKVLQPADEDTSRMVGGIASSGRIDFKSGEWKRFIDPRCSGSY